MVCRFCCVGIGWSGATCGLDQGASNNDRTGVWMKQGSFQRTDRVKEDSRETARKTQRGRLRQLRVQLRVWRHREGQSVYVLTSWREKLFSFPQDTAHETPCPNLIYNPFIKAHSHLYIVSAAAVCTSVLSYLHPVSCSCTWRCLSKRI